MFHIEQLRGLGFSDDRVALLVAQGRFRREHHGVYADALVRPTRRARLLAALLAVGPGAFLSGRTALAAHGLRAHNLRAIEVTVVADHTPRHRGIIVHRTSVEPLRHEVRVRDGLCVASAPLALLQVAARETPAELDRLIAEMARNRLLDLDRVDLAIERRRGLRGIPKLRDALGRYRPSPRDKSGFERALADWLATDPDIPTPERNVRLGPWELDFYWRRPRVVLEADGDRYHLTPAERERDAVKDAWLQRHGQLVLRVTEFRFMQDRRGIRSDLLAMLHLHSIRS